LCCWPILHKDCKLFFSRSFGHNDIVATEPQVDGKSKCLTGRFFTANCHGAEKVERLSKLLGNIDDYDIWAYGDSDGDEDMLSIANHPKRV